MKLGQEIKYLKSFIQLSLLKEENSSSVRTNFEAVDPNLSLASMLLIPFVENSFKHSNFEDKTYGWIDMELKTEGHQLFFVVKNSIGGQNKAKDGQGGIGLENTRRRLAILYPNRHNLTIQKSPNEFYVQLKIDLHES